VEQPLLERARRGDDRAFAALAEQHRRALHVHCYRMLGSLHDAEDAVQETLLRGWRGLGGFGARASLRTWLCRIATNVCIDIAARRPPRVLPEDVAPADDPTAQPAPDAEDVPWIEPYPDELLDELQEEDPAHRYAERESIELAFVVALQRLPPLQRAVLILRDVLAYSAQETAEMLDRSPQSVNSALQRARPALAAPRTRAPEADERRLVAAYVRAWEDADVAGLVALLREDVHLAMPPTPSWYAGRDAVAAYFRTLFAGELGARLHLTPTRANRQPAFLVTLDGQPFALKLLTLEGDRIAAVTGFTEPRVVAYAIAAR